MKSLVLLFVFFASNIVLSQPSPDSIRTLFPQNYGTKKWKVLLSLDAHRSFYSGTPVKINGLRIGTELNGVHRFGIGFYALKKNVEFTKINVDYPGATDTSVVRFNVSYTSLFYERVFFKTRKWEFSIPTYFGAGTIEGIYQDSTGNFLNLIDKPFSALGIGSQAKYYIWPWLAPRISIGYRITFNTDKEVKQAFNNLYYSYGLSISIGELYRAIFKNDLPRKAIRYEVDKNEVPDEELD